MASAQTIIFEAVEGQGKVRLDKFLTEQITDKSRSQIQKLIKNGHVLVNGEAAAVHTFLKEGDEIHIEEVALQVQEKPDGSIDLDIIYEDDDVVVINKPAGVIVHQFAQQLEYSLADEIVKRYPEIATVGDDPVRPGIVHRLDKHASGLIVIAKNQAAFDHLKAQFKNREVHKKYFVLADGKFENQFGSINFRIGRANNAKNRMAAFPTNSEFGKDALSHYEVLKMYKNYSLLDIEIETGRTHQIRVHMFASDAPVVGEHVYGVSRVARKTQKTALDRLFLHAHTLEFWQPKTGEKIRCQVELPLELKRFLNKLTPEHPLIMVSGPSGAGKTTLIKDYLEKHPKFGMTTTYTTREQRSTAPEDKIMHSVSAAEFEAMIEDGAFLEWAKVFDNYYGTHQEAVRATLKHQPILMNIDVQGMAQIIRKMPEAYTIFIDVAHDEHLKNRLIARGDVSEESLEIRLNEAQLERSYKSRFDAVLHNEDGKIAESHVDFARQIEKFLKG